MYQTTRSHIPDYCVLLLIDWTSSTSKTPSIFINIFKKFTRNAHVSTNSQPVSNSTSYLFNIHINIINISTFWIFYLASSLAVLQPKLYFWFPFSRLSRHFSFFLYLQLKNAKCLLLSFVGQRHSSTANSYIACFAVSVGTEGFSKSAIARTATPIRSLHAFWSSPIDPICYRTFCSAQEYSRKMENWPRQGLYFVAYRTIFW